MRCFSLVGGLATNRERIKARSVCAGCGKKLGHSEYKVTEDFTNWYCSDKCMAEVGVKDILFRKSMHPVSSPNPTQPPVQKQSHGHTAGYLNVLDSAKALVNLDKNLKAYRQRHGR